MFAVTEASKHQDESFLGQTVVVDDTVVVVGDEADVRVRVRRHEVVGVLAGPCLGAFAVVAAKDQP